MKILIVDDNKSNRILLANIVEKYEPGYEIDYAADGEEGLEKIINANYDIVFLDHEMPKMNGIEVIGELRIQDNHTPIIMVTIHESVKLTVSAIKLGVLDFINKPFNMGEIVKAIEKVKLKRENEQLQMHLIMQDRLSALGLAVESIGYEVAAPLSSIYYYLKKLRINSPSDQESFDKITEELQKIDRIIENCRNFSKKATDEDLIDIKSTIETTINLISLSNKSIQFKYNPSTQEDLLISGNRNDVQQVMVNIINYAIDDVEDEDKKEILIELKKEDQIIKIEVTDFGPGITEPTLSNLFNFFYATKVLDKGSGLGLPIAKNLLKKHGGKISVESDPSKTTFTIHFPISNPPI